jgi:chromosomal replication initiator protein
MLEQGVFNGNQNPGRRNIEIPLIAKRLAKHEEVVSRVIKTVISDYGLGIEEFLGSSRRADIAQARFVAAHLIYNGTDLSHRAIAVSLGRTDHTTIMNALDRVRERIDSDVSFREMVDDLSLQVFPSGS